jgi:sulfur relay (sulfurtransferase) complex TusBCD TusD component (DsrE family)
MLTHRQQVITIQADSKIVLFFALTSEAERVTHLLSRNTPEIIDMKLGVVISTNDPETCWNAFRFANFARTKNDDVQVFLIGKGVEFESLPTDEFDTPEQASLFTTGGGTTYACGSCIKSRNAAETEMCPLSTMADLYRIVDESDKVVTF